MRRRCFTAASAILVVLSTVAIAAQSKALAIVDEVPSCTRVLGGSQTSNWYTKGDFELLVEPQAWERQSRGGQTISDWAIDGDGWDTRVWSACGQDSVGGDPFLPVSNVVLHALSHGPESIEQVTESLTLAIDGIRSELPDAVTITLIPPIGGDCPGIGLADANPTVVAAIDTFVGGDIIAGPNVIVPDCSMFGDSSGHLNNTGSAWVAGEIAAWFGTADQAPSANAGPDQDVVLAEGATTADVTLDASASTDNGAIVEYVWTENSSQIATGINPTIPFTAGDHLVTLTVTDDSGQTGTDTVLIKINVPITAPSANAGPDQDVVLAEGATTANVTLDASASTDNGAIVEYVWTENSSQIATGVNPTIPFTAGDHLVTLTVTDDSGQTGTDTVLIKINAPATGVAYVADLDATGARVGKAWVATVTVTALLGGQPISGATIDGIWAIGAGATSCVTDGAGQCAFVSNEQGRQTDDMVFIVTDVTLQGIQYDPGSNTDPDGDSDGTTITVSRP